MSKKKQTRKKAAFSPKTHLLITEHQHDLLIGTLLGDGSLATRNNGQSWTYRCLQSIQQQEYLFHKYQLVAVWCSTPPTRQQFLSPPLTQLERWYFNTRGFSALQVYAELFYVRIQNGWQKRVPPNLAEILTPRAFAYWYMDDGDQKWADRSLGMRLSINCFSRQEGDFLCEILRQKWGLKTSLQRADITKQGVQQYRLYISTSSYARMKELLLAHLHPSMLYKFPMQGETRGDHHNEKNWKFSRERIF